MKKLYSIISLLGLLLLSSCSNVEIPEPANGSLQGVQNLQYTIKARNVNFTWELPKADGITGLRVFRNGELTASFDSVMTSYEALREEPNVELCYTFKLVYDSLVTEGTSTFFTIDWDGTTGAAYVLTAATPDDLPQQEQPAAKWFEENYVNKGLGVFVQASELKNVNVDEYSVMWMHIDRVGLEMGWQNLPEALINEEALAAMKAFSEQGGKFYFSKFATQLVVAMGRIDEKYAPTVFNSAPAGEGTDVWSINANIGNGKYDHRTHEIFAGMTAADPNGLGFETFPLIGAGIREDHNCMWDLTNMGLKSTPNFVRSFEDKVYCTVLATWGQETTFDHAGIVEFRKKGTYLGKIIANGVAAYQWYQEGGNAYQDNVETMTRNIIEYLRK